MLWSDIVRIFLTIVLSIAFLVLFGGKNIKRFQAGGIAKIRDEEERGHKDIPVPGTTFGHISIYKQNQNVRQCHFEFSLKGH